MAYKDVILADSPLAYWRMSATTTTEPDQGSGGHLLTYNVQSTSTQATTSLLPNREDLSLLFSGGSSQYASTPTTSDLTFTAAPFTVECWVNQTSINAASTQEFVAKGSVGNGGWLFRNRLGTLTLSFLGVADIGSGFTPLAGVTYYYAVVWRAAANTDFYVNGYKVRNQAVAGSPTTNSQSTAIGQDSSLTGNGPLVGGIDEVAIYNTALSDTRIMAHAAAAANITTGMIAIPIGG